MSALRSASSRLDLRSLAAVSNIFRARPPFLQPHGAHDPRRATCRGARSPCSSCSACWGDQETSELAGEAEITTGTLTGVLKTLEKKSPPGAARVRPIQRRVIVSATTKGRGSHRQHHAGVQCPRAPRPPRPEARQRDELSDCVALRPAHRGGARPDGVMWRASVGQLRLGPNDPRGEPWVRSSAPPLSPTCRRSVMPEAERRRPERQGGLQPRSRPAPAARRVPRPAAAGHGRRLRHPLVHHVRARRVRTTSGPGLYTSEELPRTIAQLPYDYRGDPELADAIAVQADGRSDVDPRHPRSLRRRALYPTINLLPYLQRDERWLSVSVADRHEGLPPLRRRSRARSRRSIGGWCCSFRRALARILGTARAAPARGAALDNIRRRPARRTNS